MSSTDDICDYCFSKSDRGRLCSSCRDEASKAKGRVTIKRNPWRHLTMGTRVWVRRRNDVFQTSFHSVKKMKVVVWDPIGVTQDIFLEVDPKQVSREKPKVVDLRVKR